MFEVASEAERVLARVAAIGVPWTGTRFARYLEIVREHMNPSREFIRRYRRDEHVRRLTFEAGSQLIQLVLAEVVWDRLDHARCGLRCAKSSKVPICPTIPTISPGTRSWSWSRRQIWRTTDSS